MAIYREDDWTAEVEIVSNNSDDEFERYELKVVETFQESNLFNTGKIGDIFEVEKRQNVACPGLWTLEDD